MQDAHGDARTTGSHPQSIPRVAVPRSPGRTIATSGSEYAITSIEWRHYNTLYQLLDYASHWPQGMAAHAAWQSGGEGHAIYFWDARESMDIYFATVAADRIAEAINLSGTIRGPKGQAVDVEPEPLLVHDLVFGPLAREFCDIGRDVDGAAINRLGQPPTVLQIELEGFDDALNTQLSDALGFYKDVPTELIARSAYERDGTWCALEIWSDSESGLQAFQSIELPELNRLAKARGVDLRVEHSADQLSRVVFGGEAVGAFGF
jgi:hypothetical protein